MQDLPRKATENMIRKFEETPEWWAEYDAWKAALPPNVRELFDAVEGSCGHGGMDDEGTNALVVLVEMAKRAMFWVGDRVSVHHGGRWLTGKVRKEPFDKLPDVMYAVDLDEPMRDDDGSIVTQIYASREFMRPAP